MPDGQRDWGGFPLRARVLFFLVVLGVPSCGEFHTRWLWEEDCPAPHAVLPAVPKEIEARLNEPLVVRLAAEGKVLEWQVADGIVPEGLRLHGEEGLLWGIPEVEGDYPLVLRAVPPDGYCLLPADVPTTVRVAQGCDGRDQCSASAGLVPHCGEDRVCSVSGDWTECPAVFGEGIAWSLDVQLAGDGEAADEADGGGLPPGPWLVAEHRELSTQDKLLPGQEPYSHRMDLVADEDSVVLRYRLPDLWPLPFGEGDELALSSLDAGLVGRELAAWSTDGALAARLHEGILLGPHQLCPLDVCGVEVEQLHVDGCPGEEVQCGRGRPDVLVAGGRACLAGGHVRLDDPSAGWLAVGAAYSYEPGTFREELCPGVAPLHSSFSIQPLERCPVARIYSAMEGDGVIELGAASVPPPDAVFTGLPFEAAPADDPLSQGGAPTAPDGTPLASWHWSIAQPYEGLVRLETIKKSVPSPEDGPEPRRLPLTAVGIYSVLLEVVDEKGRAACVPDLAEVVVRASAGIDLRVEAVWNAPEGGTGHDLEADLLLMPPPYARYLAKEHGDAEWPSEAWANPAFVCSELNPQPPGWKSSPSSEASPRGSPPPPDYSCQVAGGQIPLGLPEVITVRDLDRDKKSNRYPLAVAASSENDLPLQLTLRVFLDGKPRYETRQKVLAPGQVWTAGYVDVGLEKFVSAL
ncbi:MAG: hypothetical protein FJ109_06570 [Deltaproteobacteria bacterium]|nr:hypothetical protein [Deltaproteobacteria bacterium]